MNHWDLNWNGEGEIILGELSTSKKLLRDERTFVKEKKLRKRREEIGLRSFYFSSPKSFSNLSHAFLLFFLSPGRS